MQRTAHPCPASNIPADKVQNWVGGTTNPQAALQILNQVGIAAMGLATGGQITTIRLEHVWVNAYVNWSPSRGAKDGGASLIPSQHPNPNANLNAWTPLDASYKQYSYSQGMDLKTAVPLDANALLSAAQQGATVNAAQGWVQNLNQAAIQSQLNAYQARLKTYIDSTPTGPNSTVGDVIGKKIIPQQAQPMLAGTLQNVVVMKAQEVSAIPSNLQHKFTYRLYASQTDQANENPMLSFTEKTSKLVGKRLTLSYVPATQADADVIASYLPRPHSNGSPILPSELPTSLPGYLIKLKPQINLDGQVVASSNTSVQMGTDLYSTGGFTQLYDASQWDLTGEESNVAGQATAIGISAGGISGAQLNAIKDRLSTAKAKLQANDFAGLTGEQISGDLLSATIWSWFASTESHNRLSQNEAGVIENTGLSYGLFHAVANPVYSWGVIRRVTFPGVNIDVGHVRNLTWAKDNNAQSWVTYNRLRGQYMSALEHAVPERFFSNPAQCNSVGVASAVPGLPACPQGISAMKAIALGAQAGQKVFTITAQVYQDNPNIVATSLSAHSQSTKSSIQQALDAGYEVTTHAAPVTQNGWTGSGFMMIDTATGAGGYIIDGGSNGGYRDHLTSSTGVRLLSMFGVNAPPSSYSAPDLFGVIDVATLAIYSAVNTVSEIWECHQAQIGESVNTILLALAVAALIAVLIGSGGLASGVLVALAILLGPTTASAAQSGRPECAPPKMRVQFQVSPRANGTQTFETYATPIEGVPGVGVTTRQVRDTMAAMYSNRPSWIPAGVDLRGMIVEISEDIKRFPPFGTDGVSRYVTSRQVQYGSLFYRVDIENFNAVNLKE